MKTRLLLCILLVGAVLGLRALGEDKKDAAKDEKKFAATCPVSGQPAKEASSVEFKGKKIYFCCDNCPAAFKKEPTKFAAKVHHQLLQTSQIVQVACPLTGRAINKDAVLDDGDCKVAFCCMNCLGKAKAAKGDEQTSLVFLDISKGFTVQTTCPVSGKAIDITKSVKYKDKNVYFCCPNCPKAFEANPAKFEAKLPQLAKDEKPAK